MSAPKDELTVKNDTSFCSKVYACGYNGFRQLSSKEIEVIDVPVEFVKVEDERCGINVVKIVSSLSRAFTLWNNGSVSVLGCTPGSSFPGNNTNLLPGQTIKDIACIDDQVVLITQQGKLLSWRDYLYTDSKIMQVQANVNDICQVSCGDLHTVVTTRDGYVCKVHPTCDTDEEEKYQPIYTIQRMEFSHQVQSVGCGKEHVLLLTLNGNVFSFGGGSRGQLGNGSLDKQDQPALIEALDGIQITKIACGGWHSAVTSSSGDVYCWGWNKDGQVGINDDDLQVQAVPVPITVTDDDDDDEDLIVTDVSCGTRHTAIVTACGEVWTWGWGFYGQLGTTNNIESHYPIKLPLTNASRVWCSHWNTFILVKQEKQDSAEQEKQELR